MNDDREDVAIECPFCQEKIDANAVACDFCGNAIKKAKYVPPPENQRGS